MEDVLRWDSPRRYTNPCIDTLRATVVNDDRLTVKPFQHYAYCIPLHVSDYILATCSHYEHS